ncbi:DUF2480 family protein [Hugenholtzia roseola]|uniref:DUF2480 family protein n=1 Tax=Hugenholtzia roseola TaxID=1002 RepID=UPI00047D87D2|nr:DUF2480 family protein [Hugenholtzia roseola]
METPTPLQNRLQESSIITFDLEQYYPIGERTTYDLAQNLFQGLILREKDLREFVKTHDWEAYRGKHVALFCSADAIIPTWAYLILTAHLQKVAQTVIFGDMQALETHLYLKKLETVVWEDFRDKKVVIKGCSEKQVPTAVYVEAMRRLAPIAKLLMFGEACSSVPLYKKSPAQ